MQLSHFVLLATSALASAVPSSLAPCDGPVPVTGGGLVNFVATNDTVLGCLDLNFQFSVDTDDCRDYIAGDNGTLIILNQAIGLAGTMLTPATLPEQILYFNTNGPQNSDPGEKIYYGDNIDTWYLDGIPAEGYPGNLFSELDEGPIIEGYLAFAQYV